MDAAEELRDSLRIQNQLGLHMRAARLLVETAERFDAEITIAKDGKVRMLAQFHDFHGWDAHALWDDIKFSTTHCTKIEKIALVGEKAWEAGMAQVCKPFTMAKIKYFDSSQLDAAWNWLEE